MIYELYAADARQYRPVSATTTMLFLTIQLQLDHDAIVQSGA